nr:hypothetical protein [Marinobacterium ramblicola]
MPAADNPCFNSGRWAKPATSDSRTTSVGSAAINRFLRPVCYQELPQAMLPASIKDGNPLGIRRLIGGQDQR